jgi:cellulose synthase/poly-beta-1,6-N-acetylglucosamine synthase-like glycosyltransferase
LKQKNASVKVVFISLPERQGKPSVINQAIQHCSGDILVITDADTLLKKDEIKQFLQRFRDAKVGAICGRLVMSNYQDSSASNIEESYRDVFDVIRLGESVLDSTPVFNGALIALRKSLFTPLKSDTLADDTELSFKIRRQGFNTVFDPNTIIYTDTPKRFKDRTTQKIRRAQGIIQSFYWHKDMLFSREFGKFGSFIFPCEFFMHILSPIIVAFTVALFFYIVLATPLLYMIVPFVLGLILIVFGIFGIEVMFSKIKKNSSITVTSSLIKIFKLLATFVEHQMFLGVALLFLLFGRVNVKWKRT